MLLDMTKRLFDLSLSIVAFIVLMPVLALVYILVGIKLGRPVLFRQSRTGRGGRLFQLYKFRSMTSEVDASGRLLPDAVRLTTFGRLLRRTSLDELPELFNIIRGDMSLVGPRPLLPQYLDHYSERQNRRHEVLPGLTGWAQVNGRNGVGWNERFEMDVWYVENQSLALDIKILLLTILAVLSPSGISASSHATMPPFAKLDYLNESANEGAN
jgi:sugar transferase EpsL